jgi:hypothetical protein
MNEVKIHHSTDGNLGSNFQKRSRLRVMNLMKRHATTKRQEDETEHKARLYRYEFSASKIATDTIIKLHLMLRLKTRPYVMIDTLYSNFTSRKVYFSVVSHSSSYEIV